MFATVDLTSAPFTSRLSTGRRRSRAQKLAVDMWRTPERVLEAHSSDKVAHLFVDLRSATERAGFPSPERTEAFAMPTRDRFRP